MYENTLEWTLVGVTSTVFLSSFFHMSSEGIHINRRPSRLTQFQRGMMLLYVFFLPIVSHYALSFESFRLQVMKWHADESQHSDQIRRPVFEHDLWNDYGAVVFTTTLLLLASLYIAYFYLTGSLRPAMEDTVHRRHDEEDLYMGASSSELREKPVVKRVTFDLPENKAIKIYKYLSKQVLRHIRPIMRFVLYALLVTFLLPASLQHAFYYEITSIRSVTFTSDHVIITFALYFCVELVLCNFAMSRPVGYSEVRFMASRFTLCYGAFLIVTTVLAILQFNDTSKLYLYRMYEPHDTFKDRPTSFYDSSIPNINVVSMFLENYMTKYSYSLIRGDTSSEQRNEIIKSSLDIFTNVYSDCIACLLFATMVFMPGVLGILI